VLITALRDGIYFADLVLLRGGEEIRVSARPSDAIALAARTGAPIFVLPSVLDEAARARRGRNRGLRPSG
jgi:bifunctional DNase/RNase